jgi:NADH dehydrogenase
MRVLVTGATGFVGNEVVRELLAQGHRVRVLVRPGSQDRLQARDQVGEALGDILDREAVFQAAQGCDAVINLVGIIREFPRRGVTFERLHVEATHNAVDAARAAGARHYLQMSALGARPEPADPYHTTNHRADEYVRASGLAWTIFRPSVIYGPGDQSINLFAQMIKSSPVYPVIGDGNYRMQPVPVWKVARAFAQALELPDAIGKIYDVGGLEPLTFNEIIDTIAEVLGKKIHKLHLPVWPLRLAAGLLGGFPWFPVTTGQIRMLLEGNTCDPAGFYQDFGLAPVSLKEGLSRYLAP